MSETLQLDQVTIVEFDDAPKLLVEWSPRWREFVTSIGPAFARSGPRLAGEAPLGLTAYRGLIASLLLQVLLLFALIALPRQIDRLRPFAAPRLRPDEVVYYSGDELPRTEDLSGSQTGKSAAAGGQQAHHRTQTIRISRGNSQSAKVVDAPDLKLPSSAEAVANLLAYKSNPALPIAPAPAVDGLHSSLRAPALSARVIAPAPEINSEHSRSGLTLNSVVPPAPKIASEQSRSALSLNSAVVPPAPTAPSEHALIAPRPDASIIGPAPNISRQNVRGAPALNANVVAPAPTQVSAAPSRSAPALTARVIAPAPLTSGTEVPSTRVRMTNVAVVPPPVSAPEREDVRKAKLNLPAPEVIAPPPSADSAHELRRLESGVAASSPTVVPPPPTQPAAPSFMSNIIGKIFGTQDVVPPPPSVSPASRSGTGTLTAEVVPPPPSVTASPRGAPSSGNSVRTLAPEIVPPAPSASGASGIFRVSSRAPAAVVVPPPPSVGASGPGGPTARTGPSRNSSPQIVPPPPTVSSASSPGPSYGSSSYGSSRKFVAPAELGSALAPPKDSAVNNSTSGIVASAQPGSSVALPANASRNSLAISPTGGEKPGLGGPGSGSGIGNSKGTGSGLTPEKPSENSGAGKSGTGHGFDQPAHAGISTTPGPGGAGSLAAGTPAVPGVDVHGGTTVVTLPSFGSDGGDPNPPPRRSNVKSAEGPSITIVATSRSGGAFNFYGELPGDNYTVYVDTSIGTVVMQFAEANPGARSQLETLTGPEAIRTDLPANLPHARMVVKCRLTASGNITSLQVLEPGPATMTAKIINALSGWKFRPAMRGAQPVEVNAILGFNINTNDRN
ncbi:MAG: energy transducer TonB [Candidatus Sulfotelmatobacter sp.]